MFELSWWEIIVFDGITRSKHFDVLKTRYGFQCSVLYIFWQGGTETIDVNLNGVPSFGFYKNLMSVSICKTRYFIFYTWAIPRATTFDRAIKHRGTIETCAEQFMCLLIGIGDMTRELFG